VPQNMHLAVVDCEAISARVSGRGCCRHIDAQAVGKRSGVEAAGPANKQHPGSKPDKNRSRQTHVDQ
jgi:hypothetical protein